VKDLHPNEELSDDCISELMQQFVKGFSERYPASGPALFMGSLHQALTHSLYNQPNVCILLLLNGNI
jgi:hypothetical protein